MDLTLPPERGFLSKSRKDNDTQQRSVAVPSPAVNANPFFQTPAPLAPMQFNPYFSQYMQSPMTPFFQSPLQFPSPPKLAESQQSFPTIHRASSPVTPMQGLSASEMMDEYFLWFTERELKRYKEGEEMDEAKLEIQRVKDSIKSEDHDLDGVHKMNVDDYQRLGVKIGLGRRLLEKVREFEKRYK
jgi:hypothetical protein